MNTQTSPPPLPPEESSDNAANPIKRAVFNESCQRSKNGIWFVYPPWRYLAFLKRNEDGSYRPASHQIDSASFVGHLWAKSRWDRGKLNWAVAALITPASP